MSLAATKDSSSSEDVEDSDSDFEMEPLVSDIEFDSDDDGSDNSGKNDDASSAADADDEEDIVLEPLFLVASEEQGKPPNIPQTLRQRRQSKSNPVSVKNLLNQKRSSSTRAPALDEVKDEEIDVQLENGKRCPKAMWKKAMRLLRRRADPWLEYHIEKYKTYPVVRHRYNALKKAWVQDQCFVKMEPAPFNHGAMRECYRLKKMMKKNCNWLRAHDYVAKKYIQNVDRHIYFEDVVLQLDAKLWGEEYNRHRPPKKVDIFQMSVIEFVEEPDSPLYHLEHFIEGEYIKYNSNSGFVEEQMRFTPHAFSHFTFERSGHELIVIDIQGVGDLYTDPQIHTTDGKGYGDGNLGTRGMALFFHSHVCNKICQTLKLAPFDLAPLEREQTGVYMKMVDAATKIRGYEEMCISPSPQERIDLSKFFHHRTISCSSRGSNNDSGEGDSHNMSDDHELSEEETDDYVEPPNMFRRMRNPISESENDTWSKEEERQAFTLAMKKNHRSSCIQAELNKLQFRRLSQEYTGVMNNEGGGCGDESILGRIHLDLAKYHEAGRFTLSEGDIDQEATFFHLEQAAKLGIDEAIQTLGRLYLDMQRDLLTEYKSVDYEKGLQFMEKACDGGSREAAVLLGKAYQHGHFSLKPDWSQAIHFLEIARELAEDGPACVSAIETPNYTIMAAIAQMQADGGYGIDASPQKAYDLYTEAAELAQAALKGRLAMKYYTLAEEVGAVLEE